MGTVVARIRTRGPRTAVGVGSTAAGWALVHTVHLAATAAAPTIAAAVHFVCRIP